jgi:serine protease Do
MAFLLIVFSLGLAAQVKYSVATVYPKVTPDWAKSYKKMADYFSPEYQKVADYLEGKAKGGFGSGFVVLDSTGKKIVITNQHVVSDAAIVDLEFAIGEEKTVKITDCPIILKDDTIDLAIIDLPDQSAVSAVPLSLEPNAPEDGSDVWSAGYPGLGSKPVWQLGKGVITNRHLILEEVGLKEYSDYIQHSATIDPGNSGGPLLYGPINKVESLKVVGMNTLYFGDRQNTFFALSAKRIKEAVDKLPSYRKAAEADISLVEAKAREFVTSLTAEKWDRYQAESFVSYDLAFRQGWTSFLSTVRDKSTAEDWTMRFFNGITPNVLRESLYNRMYKSFHDKAENLAFVSIEPVEKKADSDPVVFKVKFSRKAKEYTSYWVCELGNWHLTSINFQELENKAYAQKADGTVAATADQKASGTGNSRTARAAKTENPDDWGINSGLAIAGGLTEIPLIAGWTPSYNLEVSYIFGLGRVIALDVGLGLNNTSGLVNSGVQLQETRLGISGSLKVGYAIGADKSFYVYPYATIIPTLYLFNLNGLTPPGGSSSSSSSSSASASPLLIGGSAGIGVEFGFDGFAVGLQGLASGVIDNSRLRLNAIPIRVYVVF